MNQPRRPTSIEPVFENADVIAYKPRDDLWLFQTTEGVPVSVYILEGSEKALVIDSGHMIKNLKENIQKVTQKPLIFALTHAHQDHTGSINEFDTVYMDIGDKALLPADYKGEVITIRHGHKFDLGNREIEAFEMHGHTQGSIGFLDKKGRFIISGDAIGHTVVWMHLTRLPLESLLDTLRHLKSIEGEYDQIYTGHYNQSNRPLDHQYVDDLYELTEKVCRAGEYHAEPYNCTLGIKYDFQPMIVTGRNGVGIVYNPQRIHYI